MHRFHRWWWLLPVALPVLIYAGLISAAYIKPPLHISGMSYGHLPQPAAVVHVENESRRTVALLGVAVKGVLPPDEVGALRNGTGEIPTVSTLINPLATKGTGELTGRQVHPKQQSGAPPLASLCLPGSESGGSGNPTGAAPAFVPSASSRGRTKICGSKSNRTR